MRTKWGLPLLFLLVLQPLHADPVLPPADDVDWSHLRKHGQQLLDVLKSLETPLPARTEKSLRDLFAEEQPRDPGVAAVRVQELLDPHCLIGVTINPESRVKAARGPLPAELTRNRETIVIVKVVNQGGVRHALAVSGPQLHSPGQTGDGRWLEAAVVAPPPLGKGLSGDRLEYVLMRLAPREAGKREATLSFDVGQGSQDLGFRADVPILFRVTEK